MTKEKTAGSGNPAMRPRRHFLKSGAALLAAATLRRSARAAIEPGGCTLGMGTYAMKNMPVEEAVTLIAETGFDSIEICARPEWDSAPENMSSERRTAVRELLKERGLRLTAVMEYLLPSKDAGQHQKDCERLRRVFELGHDLATDSLPLVQTVLGYGSWSRCREWVRDRVADWVAVAEASGAVLAIKPHRGQVVSRPEEAIWLFRQLDGTPWLRMVYDYSHFAYRDMPLADTVRESLPWIAHVAVKDAVQQGDKVVFTLPGESGVFDYEELFRRLGEGGYRGDISCEVSSMVWQADGYDARRAAETCHRNIAPIMKKAGIRDSF